jgi:hypothetical protein
MALKLYLLIAGQRHHGWGRRNAVTREAVAKVVDDTYRFHSICFSIFSTRIHTRELTMSDEVVDLVPFGASVLSLAGKCKYVLLTFPPGATVDQISIISGPKRKPLTSTMWRLRSAAFAIAQC